MGQRPQAKFVRLPFLTSTLTASVLIIGLLVAGKKVLAFLIKKIKKLKIINLNLFSFLFSLSLSLQELSLIHI